MKRGRIVYAAIGALALVGCPATAVNGGRCDPEECVAQCRAGGHANGTCAGPTCRCWGVIDAGRDEDRTAARDVAPEDAAAQEGQVGRQCPEASYIWIANSAEGTLSKLCTLNGVEVGRYVTSPQGIDGDPSRTSVGLHGDMVVTNRNTEGGPSSVTKFAAEPHRCVDRDGDGQIRTSRGGDDVLPWGEDECMLWNTPLHEGTRGIGARATAWDGKEDPETGEGGSVWIGAAGTNQVFQLDGDTGEIIWQGVALVDGYGGVMDPFGNFWMVGMICTVGGMMGHCPLVRIDTETKEQTRFIVPCGYGITADSQGRIWTSGSIGIAGSCVNRLDPLTGENVTFRHGGMPPPFFRGIAVDDQGYVWVANTQGDVFQLSQHDVSLVHIVHGVAPEPVVGIAIDFQNNVWAVSQGGNLAVKINPATYESEWFPVGLGPYTYSDMTGYQLRGVIILR